MTGDSDGQEVVLDVVAGDKGQKHTAYEGALSVSGPYGEETIRVHGDCGV